MSIETRTAAVMGKRGPRPQPTRLRLARGNPGRRKINKREPQPKGVACVPDWLAEDAKEVWREQASALEAIGLLTKIDGNAFAIYCQLYARWRAAEEFLAANGPSYVVREPPGEDGAPGRVRYVGQFPQVAIAANLAAQIKNLSQEFGMTPSARSSIQVTPPDPLDVEEAVASRLIG